MPNRAPRGFDDSRLFQEPRFVRRLRPLDSEVVILKPSYGAFFDTPLETILRRLGMETLLPEMHEAELSILRRSFARVRTVDEVLEELDEA